MQNHIPARTLIPRSSKTYSSFPTFVEHRDILYFYYRQGHSATNHCHGFGGRVRYIPVAKDELLSTFNVSDPGGPATWTGREKTVFTEGNEFDAIVSRLDPGLYSLATRSYGATGQMKTFLSFSDMPEFQDRIEIHVQGVEWLAFYGKGFQWKEAYVFPAYGKLWKEESERPLLIITSDCNHFELLSCLPGSINGSALNESSIVFDGTDFIIFMRDDTYPFGIWQSRSTDLQNWEQPVKLMSYAHAPMCLRVGNNTFMVYRDLHYANRTGIAMTCIGSPAHLLLDSYEGSPYHGGYSDMSYVNSSLLIVYFIGNVMAEPYIKYCRVDLSVT